MYIGIGGSRDDDGDEGKALGFSLRSRLICGGGKRSGIFLGAFGVGPAIVPRWFESSPLSLSAISFARLLYFISGEGSGALMKSPLNYIAGGSVGLVDGYIARRIVLVWEM